MPTSRNLWTSQFAFIMVTAGAAVGLGNIWKFPYMVGDNGGGAYVILYLICVAFIGIPAMVAELLIGRRGRLNPINSLKTLSIESEASTNWRFIGWLGALILVMVLSFYSVVSGWSITYLFFSLKGSLAQPDTNSILKLWDDLLANPGMLIIFHTIFIIFTMAVIALGVNKGIERVSRWMMPALFFVLIALVIYAAIIGDTYQAYKFLFSFKVQDLNVKSVIYAMGQAFFSLACGAGAILIYGSYLSRNTNIINTVLVISILDVLVALLAGAAIFPIVFANQLSPESGPGLMFKVLPLAFSKLPFAIFVSTGFFILLFFAAWSSALSMAEPLVAMLNEKMGISRLRASIYIGLITWTLGLLSVFSFNFWQDVKLFNRWGIFEIITDLPTNILLPLGGLGFCLFAGYAMKEKFVRDEFGDVSPFYYYLWRFCIKYITPVCILIILVTNLL